MKNIVISGWEIGFKKVEYTKLLISKVGLSLSQAKQATDEVLAGKHVMLQVLDDHHKEIVTELSNLGARVDHEPQLEA